jgi:ribosomal peptide maturation radical SAM protein 1
MSADLVCLDDDVAVLTASADSIDVLAAADSGLRPVALVVMPFLMPYSPSIQLGLLKEIAVGRGHAVETLHLHLDFAAQIGLDRYEVLCSHTAHVGEWLFALDAFGAAAPDQQRSLLAALPLSLSDTLGEAGLDHDELQRLRKIEVPRYLDHLLGCVDWSRFQVVGFSSSFEQNTASFALARRLKARYPRMTLLFGGANFDGEMGVEWVRAMPFIDYAVIGEGDEAFPELLDALRSGSDPARVPGVVCRRNGMVAPPEKRPLKARLDESPIPDYREYFSRIEALALLPAAKRRLRIPFESARGCWWGEKHHCTFCGLNGSTMAFRAKSPDAVMAELAEQARRHRCFEFSAVDNILEPSYLKDFFARLSAQGSDYQFFYEVKSNLTRAHLKTLRDGGVRYIQPGIESLSTPVLSLMRKGVTAIQNVNLLRWARYYDLQVLWNLLHGFPGETTQDYDEQAALLRQLTHLQPPAGKVNRINMQRFSPMFAEREAFPVRFMRPDPRYALVYPPTVDLERAAYFFDYEFEQSLPDAALDETRAVVQTWEQAWSTRPLPRMQFRLAPGVIEIEDRRNPQRPRAYSVEGESAALYAACSDQPHSALGLQRQLKLSSSPESIEERLNEFVALGLTMREGSRFLSLALPASQGR